MIVKLSSGSSPFINYTLNNASYLNGNLLNNKRDNNQISNKLYILCANIPTYLPIYIQHNVNIKIR